MTPVDPVEVRAALAAMGARVSALVRCINHPDRKALGIWTATDLAVHLSHSIDLVTSMARGSTPMSSDFWDVPRLSDMLVVGETERDLGAIATRIDASVAALLTVLLEADGDPPRQWVVEGVEFPLSTIACHALSELVVHGADLAAADDAPWPIERATAALVLRGFLFPSMGALGRELVQQDTAMGVTVTYHVRLRGGGETYVRIDDGDMTVSDDAPGPVDCHLLVDPVAFLMVAWGRSGQWGPIAKGKLLAYGRKPWLGLKLNGLTRNP